MCTKDEQPEQCRMASERHSLELRKLTAECIQQERDNRYWWSKWVVAGAVAGLSFVGFFYGLAKEQISYLKNRSEALGIERDKIREERDKAQATREDLSSKVRDLEATRAETQRAIADAQRQMEQARGKESSLRKSIEDLTRDREKLAHNGTESQRLLTALTVDREHQAEQIERLTTDLEAARHHAVPAVSAPVAEPDACTPAQDRRKNDPAVSVSYAELAERSLSLSASSELRIGDGQIVNFGSSGFDRNHAMLLLTQIQGLVRQCPKDFPTKPRS